MVKNKRTYVPYLMTCICMIFVSYLLNFLRENKRISEIRRREYPAGNALFRKRHLLHLCADFSVLYEFIFDKTQKTGIWTLQYPWHGEAEYCRNLGLCECFDAWNFACGRPWPWHFVFEAWGIVHDKGARRRNQLCIFCRNQYRIGNSHTFCRYFWTDPAESLRQIRMSDPIELLHGGAKGEKQPKGNWFLAAAGLIMLGIAYDLAVTTENPITALKTFFLAVLLVIVATYLLFVAGSVVLCRILKRNRNYYYQAKHFVSVSSMMYRMKRNGAGLASICILSTMVLVMVSSTICLYSGKEKALKQQYPRDIQVKTYTLDEDCLKGIHEAILMGEKESGIEEKDLLRYHCLIVGGSLEEDRVIMSIGDLLSASDAVDYSKITEIVYVPLEDYNRLTGNEETLNQDEVLLCCTKRRNV